MTSMNAQHVGKSGEKVSRLFLNVVVTVEIFLGWRCVALTCPPSLSSPSIFRANTCTARAQNGGTRKYTWRMWGSGRESNHHLFSQWQYMNARTFAIRLIRVFFHQLSLNPFYHHLHHQQISITVIGLHHPWFRCLSNQPQSSRHDGPLSMSGLKIFFQNFKREFRRSPKVLYGQAYILGCWISTEAWWFWVGVSNGFCSNSDTLRCMKMLHFSIQEVDEIDARKKRNLWTLALAWMVLFCEPLGWVWLAYIPALEGRHCLEHSKWDFQ